MYNENYVIFKGTKDGVTVIFDPEVSFETLCTQLEKKVAEAGKFFDNVKTSLAFKGRVFTEEEEETLLKIIAKHTTMEITFVKTENNEIKRLSDRLDAIRHQQADLSLVEAADKYAELEKEKATLEAEIARLRDVHSQKLSKEAQKLMNLPYRRAISKKEQADMGKLKKSVRGLVVVHPMTALGREMGLQEMTGFAKTEF